MTRPKSPSRPGPAWPLAAAGVTVLLWRVPYGKTLLYPVSLLADWFHEMGHGMTAVLLGGHFDRLLLYPNGSGLAQSGGSLLGGKLGWALVSAGGLLGSSAAGFLLLRFSRTFSGARLCLWVLGAALLLSSLLWVRNLFGFAWAVSMGAAVFWAAARPDPRLHAFAAQFLGAQALVSVFKELDYIFSPTARVNGVQMASDSMNIAKTLGGPYLLWGALVAAVALALAWLGVRAALLDRR